MASIIEAEAVQDKERPIIAGVFYNRLKKRMPLGADPTVCYAVRKFGKGLTHEDLAVQSPYNTRIHPGLPPGPIGNAGALSLKAAMEPEETPMLFFMAKYDGSQEHYFTATFEEHLKMKRIANQTLKLRMSENNRAGN